jgi:FkbM family methyltransferase
MKMHFFRTILRPIIGKRKYQRVFKALYKLSLEGMNIGVGGVSNNSGEREVLKYIKKKWDRGSEIKINIFDVGANVGHYSSLVSEIFGYDATIYSFEPSKDTFNEFLKNINTELHQNIIPFNLGFGDKPEIVKLYSSHLTSTISSIYQRNLDHLDISMDKEEAIQITTIDKFCSQSNIDSIHLLKLDVEGNEFSILNGASAIFQTGKIKFIQFEFGGCNIDSKTFFQDFFYLLKDNYKIYRILQDGLFEITEYNEICEIFLTTNFLAEKK